MVEKVRTILCETLARSPEGIDPTTHLRTLGMTSLDMVEVSLNLEEAFSIRLSEQDLAGLVTLADLVHLVSERAGERTP